MRPVTVYALVDPRDGVARYVGRSVNPGSRLTGHLSEATWGHWSAATPDVPVRNVKDMWVCELVAAGLWPEVLELETVPGSEAVEAEQAWMDACLAAGDPLLNARDARGGPLVRGGAGA